ncbi:glycosyltransferase family 4 protein [Candidatus Sumerlaeota bacterium]|nr:glycosyltransferase family 4 protein [Candidatus Sumerlaeota bacterium]
MISNYPPRQLGGMELSTQRLATALVRAGNQVSVLTQHSKGVPDQFDEDGVRVYRTINPWRFGPLWGFTYIAQFGKQMRSLETKWDFCVCRGIYLHCSSAQMICEKMGRPVATMPAASGVDGDLVQTRKARFGNVSIAHALRCDGHFALSRQIETELKEHGIPAERIFPVRNIVDLHRFSIGSAHDENLFLYAGRFDQQKNLPLLLKAFITVHHARPHARLLLIGAGAEEANLRALAAKSPAARAIEFQSWTDRLAQHYRRARAFVITSRSEGVSNSMLEAMACGTPVISTDVSGAREVLEINPNDGFDGGCLRGENGIVFDGQQDSLVGAMLTILDDGTLRAEMSCSATNHVHARHNEKECVGLFLEGCEKIIASRKATP